MLEGEGCLPADQHGVQLGVEPNIVPVIRGNIHSAHLHMYTQQSEHVGFSRSYIDPNGSNNEKKMKLLFASDFASFPAPTSIIKQTILRFGESTVPEA